MLPQSHTATLTHNFVSSQIINCRKTLQCQRLQRLQKRQILHLSTVL